MPINPRVNPNGRIHEPLPGKLSSSLGIGLAADPMFSLGTYSTPQSGGSGGGGAFSTLTPSASPFTYTNSTTGNVAVYIGHGMIADIAVTRSAVTSHLFTANNITIILAPSDSLTITYLAAPTVIVGPL